MSKEISAPPRDDLFRAIMPGVSLRSSDDGGAPVMFGHFAVFNTWAEIDSAYEGRFLERVAPGAFSKTIAENRDNMRVLFHHGMDSLGLQVLGAIKELREDDTGAYYEVSLFDGIPPLVLSGLKAGEYGASHRFRAVRDEFRARPGKSEHNPHGLPERTVIEAKVREFGPTPFPAFADTSSGVRSLTDEILLGKMAEDPERLERIVLRSGISLAGVDLPGDLLDRTSGGDDEKRAERLYSRSVDYISSTPWAMQPEALATVMQIVAERAEGHRPTQEEIQERVGVRSLVEEGDTGSVRVIPITGPIVPKATLMTEMSGGTSIERFRSQMQDALSSSDVKGIVLNIDSPGGSSALVPEMAAEIFAARGTKPIIASVNTDAASAAYWLAAQADQVHVTPSGSVGSIGVWTAHTDISAAMAQEGVKTTLVSAGKYKVEGNPFGPLSESAREHLQASVDEMYSMFVDAVALGRGVSKDTVLSEFGQGRMVTAAKAVEAGMADLVATFHETVSGLEKDLLSPGATTAAQAATVTPPSGDAAGATSAQHLAEGSRDTNHIYDKEKPKWLL